MMPYLIINHWIKQSSAYSISKKIFKRLASITPKLRTKIETLVFQDFSESNKIETSGKLEKLKGYHHYFKIRVGDYRIGIKIENDNLTFERVLHRKEIYKFFP